jgi:cadmium resistance protein CadD (predicted permease)
MFKAFHSLGAIFVDPTIILISASAFIATNLDDLFLLAVFFSHPDLKAIHVVAGQYLGFLTLLLISSLAYFAQVIISPAWISLLGIFPIIIGVKDLKEFRKTGAPTDKASNAAKNKIHGRGIFSVAAVTIGNGGDNLAVFIPLFAGMNPYSILVMIGTFLFFVGIWCLFGFGLTNNRTIGDKIKNYGHKILPLVLIVIGFIILLRGGILSL